MPQDALALLQQKSVLIVNFNPQDELNFDSRFNAFNFSKNVATSVEQSKSYLQIKKFDLIISFWENIDNENIFELLSFVRNNEQNYKIPFIVISNIITPVLIDKLIKHGITEYIVPPFNQAILTERLLHAINFPIRNQPQAIADKFKSSRFAAKTTLEEIQILVVDDVAMNIEIIIGILKPTYKVKAANNASSAMTVCLSNSPPDIILLDIMMPDIDGLTFCKQLKRNPLTQNIRVIFTTALSEVSDVIKGFELGAVDYITKPIIPEILSARVKTHCQLILQHHAMQWQIDNLIRKTRE
ncbi:response regulator [Thalassotalea nanhaiensis]|uniref:Response regulator n=1 Tax=Thalassotalea nanhaiensis TaxID=3065648 RepID=A0ABY9TFT9_9GAMM|nr:response regulator [Colwelliaceae bacterium SQ345]